MVAVVLGIALGVVLGRRPTLRRMLTPVIEFLRAIPAPALIPFAILVLGVDNDAKIFLIAVVCFFPVLLNAIDGVAGVEPTLLDTTTRLSDQRVRPPPLRRSCPPPRRRSSPASAPACPCPSS